MSQAGGKVPGDSPARRHRWYLNVIEMQLTYDILWTVEFRTDLLERITDTFRFLGELVKPSSVKTLL